MTWSLQSWLYRTVPVPAECQFGPGEGAAARSVVWCGMPSIVGTPHSLARSTLTKGDNRQAVAVVQLDEGDLVVGHGGSCGLEVVVG